MWTPEFDRVRHLVKQTKYLKANPLRQFLIRKYLAAVSSLVAQTGVKEILDVGCGEGFVAQHLSQKQHDVRLVGADLDVGVLAVAQVLNTGSVFMQASIDHFPMHDRAYDLVLCNEVLEHVHHPERALGELDRITRQYCIISVPREPHYRLANILIGANLQNWGDDPDHHGRWTYKQLMRFLRSHFEIICVIQPVLWNVALCRVNLGQ